MTDTVAEFATLFWGIVVGVGIGIPLGNWLDTRDLLYFCPRCRLQGNTSTWRKLAALGKRRSVDADQVTRLRSWLSESRERYRAGEDEAYNADDDFREGYNGGVANFCNHVLSEMDRLGMTEDNPPPVT